MKTLPSIAFGLACVATCATADAACFSMYDARNQLVYQSPLSPIDLSGPISQQMAQRFPARALIISNTEVCAETRTGVNGRGWADLAGDRVDPPASAARARRFIRRR